jgi:hypothetical protein
MSDSTEDPDREQHILRGFRRYTWTTRSKDATSMGGTTINPIYPCLTDNIINDPK